MWSGLDRCGLGLDMTRIGSMVARWLEYMETEKEALDKMEVMYKEKEEVSNTVIATQENVTESCCVPDCPCHVSGTCYHSLKFSEIEDDSSCKSVLRKYQFNCGCSEVCFSFKGQKVGSSRRTFCDGLVMSRFYKKGFVHGFSKTVDKNGKIVKLGKVKGGVKVGTWWERVEGNTWVITNDKISNKIFLYPDLTTALVGQICLPACLSSSNLDVCEVIGLGSDEGVLVPLLKQGGGVLPVSSCE